MADGFIGMAQLVSDLQALGPALQREADTIASKHAEAAAQAMRVSYPSRTGNLRRGVGVTKLKPGVWQVKNRARHVHIFEEGTERRTIHSTGANRGVMPPANPKIFVPTAIRWRARMVEQLIGLVRRVRVRGMTGSLDLVNRGD